MMGTHKHTWMPCCKDATMLAEKQLQHQRLSLGQRIGLRLHLLFCIFCRRYVMQSRAIDKYLGNQTPQTEITPDESVKLQWETMIAERMKK
ncbi:hypothetical protein ACTJJ0_31140 [Chitinophaga sp. 22321]|uniref:Zinc-finger n=1 Tax=Chitinophaga hostae TaxID=2831022 RepID=A0ABS5J8L0_9BACT|nr:hypothetical protein [Chitinophaga hostae]MBS0031546.1 hypothetical protein [Chitinophaga hostae]